ncbi:MAG: DUF411 domain-containing protein [Candidatus Latescibacteria bacterium]|jgi:hypothetical protein|nr:DUF411 domain-containing protein [Candidatus Latescibacterota bacterium]
MAVSTRAITVTLSICLLAVGAYYLTNRNVDRSMVVYMGPSCDCCEVWMDYMRQNGFTVATPVNPADDGMAYRLKIPSALAACHTAIVDGYIVEGHVPSSDVNRLLSERPDVLGLAVPGMPVGSPGMEGPNPEIYETLSFDRNAHIATYATHGP